MSVKRKVHLTVLSFGGGQDSTAMLYKYVYDESWRKKYAPGDFLVVQSDTGDEHDHTWEHVQEVKRFCLIHKIEFVHLTSDMGYHSPAWPNIIEPQMRGADSEFTPTLIQLGTKTCTLKVKVDPIYKYLDAWINTKYGYGLKVNPKTQGCGKAAFKRFFQENGHIDVLIGYAAGEESRAEKSKRLEEKQQASKEDSFWKTIHRVFPLVEEGLDRAACQEYIKSVGHAVPFPSNCMRCPYMSAEELLWLSINHPIKFEEWCQMEQAKLDRHQGAEKNHGVFNTKKTIRDRLVVVQAKYKDMPAAKLTALLEHHKMNHGCGSGGY
jgi:hypothetical protein